MPSGTNGVGRMGLGSLESKSREHYVLVIKNGRKLYVFGKPLKQKEPATSGLQSRLALGR